MLGPSLDRGDRRVREEAGTHTKQDLGTNDTASHAAAVTTSESDQETKGNSVKNRAEDDEGFESSNLHDDETERHAGQGRSEGVEVRDSLSRSGGLTEADNESRVQVGTLNSPSWRKESANCDPVYVAAPRRKEDVPMLRKRPTQRPAQTPLSLSS